MNNPMTLGDLLQQAMSTADDPSFPTEEPVPDMPYANNFAIYFMVGEGKLNQLTAANLSYETACMDAQQFTKDNGGTYVVMGVFAEFTAPKVPVESRVFVKSS